MDLLNSNDFGFKGMFSKLAKGSPKLDQVLAMVGIMLIQSVKGACMVCPQRLVSHYWPSWEFNHEEVFRCIHGIQMHADYGNLRRCKVGSIEV